MQIGIWREGVRTGAFLLGAQEGTEEGCVCRRSCCGLFRQQALTPATVPGQGQLRWPRGAQCAPLNKIKIWKNQTSLIFPDFYLVLFARELAWRLNQAGGNEFVRRLKLGRPLGVQRALSARKSIPWDGFQRKAGRKAPDRSPLAQSSRPRRPRTSSPSPISVFR